MAEDQGWLGLERSSEAGLQCKSEQVLPSVGSVNHKSGQPSSFGVTIVASNLRQDVLRQVDGSAPAGMPRWNLTARQRCRCSLSTERVKRAQEPGLQTRVRHHRQDLLR